MPLWPADRTEKVPTFIPCRNYSETYLGIVSKISRLFGDCHEIFRNHSEMSSERFRNYEKKLKNKFSYVALAVIATATKYVRSWKPLTSVATAVISSMLWDCDFLSTECVERILY